MGPPPRNVAQVVLVVEAGTYEMASDPGTAIFDNVHVFRK